ncbi:MAG: hypothetical protein JO082_11835 [Mycobacterium sp.]|nr:hypothetical protein [Mycobacterium sp.]
MAITIVFIVLVVGFIVVVNVLSVVLGRRIFGRGALKESVATVRSLFGRPSFKGSALTGTAQVVSVASTGTMINYQYVYKIGLRVELPGREPYDVTVRQPIHPMSVAALQPGSTLRVQVDSADPQNVRMDSSQPASATAVGSPSAPPTLAQLAEEYHKYKQDYGSVPFQFASAGDVLQSGQRVRGVLKSFAPTGDTARSLGKTPSRPELLDAPRYLLEVELKFSNLSPVIGRNSQAVPAAEVPHLAIGREITCAVDPADPSNRFVVNWDGATN